VLTKLDVLDGVKALQVGVGYNLGGERIDILRPAPIVGNCEPIYEEIPAMDPEHGRDHALRRFAGEWRATT